MSVIKIDYEKLNEKYDGILIEELKDAKLYNIGLLNCTSPFSEHYGCHNCTIQTCSMLNGNLTNLETTNKKIITLVKLININVLKSLKIIMSELKRLDIKSRKLNTIPHINLIRIENYNHSLSFIENIENYTKIINMINLRELLFDICIFLDIFYNSDNYIWLFEIKNKYDIINSDLYKHVFDKLMIYYI